MTDKIRSFRFRENEFKGLKEKSKKLKSNPNRLVRSFSKSDCIEKDGDIICKISKEVKEE